MEPNTESNELVTGIDGLFWRAVRSLRDRAHKDGKKLSRALDQYQVEAYELASLRADLYAVNSIRHYAASFITTDETSLESRLAAVFVAETAIRMRGRFDRIRRSMQISGEDLSKVFDSLAADEFFSQCLDPRFIEETGRQVVQAGSNGRSLLDHEHELMSDSFTKIAEDIVAPIAESIHRDDQTVPDEIIRILAEMGCFALSIPERFGGSAPETGQNNLAMCVVTEELSRASLAAAGSPLTRPEIAARAILAGGCRAQQEKWLPSIAKGDPLVAISVTEPDCGSDVAAIRLKATPVSDGWKLNGSKTWCTFAGRAGLLLVLARTDPDIAKAHKGLSLFLVEKPSTPDKHFEVSQSTGGKLSGSAIPTIGYRGMHSFSLFFDDFFVPAENLVGGPEAQGKGFYLTMQGFSGGRLQTAARACGVMRAAFHEALRYSKDRSVFGQTLDTYQLTRAKLVSMAANLRACQEMTYEVARLMDVGDGQMEASLVKLYACRAAESITREALQLHGGMGYSEEMPVSRYFVDARVLSIFEGAEETLALKVVAKELVGSLQ